PKSQSLSTSSAVLYTDLFLPFNPLHLLLSSGSFLNWKILREPCPKRNESEAKAVEAGACGLIILRRVINMNEERMGTIEQIEAFLMGHAHIPQAYAQPINACDQETFNP
ncbi:MAG: hypothetical protein LBQ81_09210, partial [Zoogloeaceae bacterium]|nr:hypothetical protein [Zoogloeaceae bacterium]